MHALTHVNIMVNKFLPMYWLMSLSNNFNYVLKKYSQVESKL